MKPTNDPCGADCPYCAGEMCARLDGLGCTHSGYERHGYRPTRDGDACRHPVLHGAPGSRGRRCSECGAAFVVVSDLTVCPVDDRVCPACHHPDHDPGSCEWCPRCELHTDEALAWLVRVHPELLDEWRASRESES